MVVAVPSDVSSTSNIFKALFFPCIRDTLAFGCHALANPSPQIRGGVRMGLRCSFLRRPFSAVWQCDRRNHPSRYRVGIKAVELVQRRPLRLFYVFFYSLQRKRK